MTMARKFPDTAVAPLIAVLPTSEGSQYLDPKLQPSQEQHYCKVCSGILFYDLNENILKEFGHDTEHGESSFTLLIEYERGFTEEEKDQCPLRSFVHKYRSSALNNYRLLGPLGRFTVVRELCRKLEDLNRLVMDPNRDTMLPQEITHATLCTNGMNDISRPQRVPKRFDASRARLWLDDCKMRHGSTCGEDVCGVEGMRLIDCECMLIVDAEPSWPWLALSYVWGGPDLTPFPDTPRTITDAITVTKMLGYRYLWVDQYCIDQSNVAFKMDQIAKMDQIYRDADLTIVAAMGDSKHCGLPGITTDKVRREATYEANGRMFFFSDSDPESDIRDKSPWYQRAWTYQEGYLSRRLLVFAEEQTAFFCKGASWMESWGGIEHMKQPKCGHEPSLARHKQAQPWSNPGSLFQIADRLPSTINAASKTSDRLYDLLNLLQQYTYRALSFDSDALNAFSGVMQHLRRTGEEPILYDVCGLPFIPSIGAESQQICFMFIAVSWSHPDAGSNTRRRPQFPSWTWAGWTGGIHWSWDASSIGNLAPLMQDVTFGAEGVDRMQPHNRVSCDQLKAVTKIGFKAPVIPASCFSVVEFCAVKDTSHYIYIWGKQASADYSRLWVQGTPKSFIDKISNGTWSCMFLGSMGRLRFLLVVEWQGDSTAVRIGSIEFNVDVLKYDPRLLEWRSVTLV